MEVNILEEKDNKIAVEVKEESHTLCNLIRDELWNNKGIELAGYNIEHPLISNPVITVETNDGKPKKALTDAVSDLKKKTKELREVFKQIK